MWVSNNINKSVLKEIYFTRDGPKKCPRGKLYSKYFNKLRNFKNRGLAVPLQLCKEKNGNKKEFLTRTFEDLDTEISNTYYIHTYVHIN